MVWPQVIVFSQFWQHMMLIAQQLRVGRVRFAELRTSMRPHEKTAALHSFRHAPSVSAPSPSLQILRLPPSKVSITPLTSERPSSFGLIKGTIDCIECCCQCSQSTGFVQSSNTWLRARCNPHMYL